MRWAVPSSKVGSWDSASAAAERASGVDAAGFASDFASGFRWGAFEFSPAAPIGATAAGLGAGGTAEFWENALPVVSSMATARMALFRMFQSNSRRAAPAKAIGTLRAPIRNSLGRQLWQASLNPD